MEYFNFSTVRKTTGEFGALFSNIRIKHKDTNSITQKDFRVPLIYANSNSWYQKIRQRSNDKNDIVKIQQHLPMISFELESMQYDSSRKQSDTLVSKRLNVDETLEERIYRQTTPVPYLFSYNVAVMSKNIDEGLQIVEQLCAEFSPTKTITIKEIPEIGLERDVLVDLVGVTSEDSFEGSLSDLERILKWNFQFTVKGYILKRLEDSELIREINIAISANDDKSEGTNINVNVDPIDADENESWEAILTKTDLNNE